MMFPQGHKDRQHRPHCLCPHTESAVRQEQYDSHLYSHVDMTLNRTDSQYTGFVRVKVRVKYDIRVLESKGFDVREVHAVVATSSQLRMSACSARKGCARLAHS